METYLAFKNQIQGFEDLSETVKTMEKIAASSIHYLKIEVANLNEYTNSIEGVLARLSLFYSSKNHPLLQRNGGGRKTLLMVTGDKGLVGGLWHNIVNLFLEKAADYKSVVVLGSKGKNYLEEEGMQIIKSFDEFAEMVRENEVNSVANYLFDGFKKKIFSKVDILYPQFISLAEQKPAFVPFLPFEFVLPQTKFAPANLGLPIFEPSKRLIFDELLQKYIGVYLYKIILEAKLSELSARTVAMENASAKTKDFILKLESSFRKERRGIVTQRQIESFTAHRTV